MRVADVRVTDAEVIIAGAGPTGLMLAVELCLGGVRPLVLERDSQLRDTSRAGGIAGQITQLLDYRGLLERFEAASGRPVFSLGLCPFGDLHLDFSPLADRPLRGLQLRQQQLERLLDERARELGADIRRGAEIVGVSQDDDSATADVRGPGGLYRVSARYLVGCDGGSSKIRAAAGIPFPGTTYPEVNRLARLTLPDSVTRLVNGDLDVPGLGIIRAGFTRTERGVFALGSTTPDVMGVQTTEDANDDDVDDDAPMTLAELQDSIRRVLGANLPLGKPLRLTRYRFHARQAERFRDGRILLAGDAAHLFPSTGVSINAGMLDAVNLAWKLAADIRGWAPAGLLDTYHGERHFAGARAMLHTQAQMALRRRDDPAVEALREVFRELLVDEQPLRRVGMLIAGTDIRYPLANANQHALTGTFVTDLTLHADHGTTRVAEFMHRARPVFIDLADRSDLREIAREWQHRIDIHIATTPHRPADALLIRPDAGIAWAATIDEPADTAASTLREALSTWFGACDKRPHPRRATLHMRGEGASTRHRSVTPAADAG